MRGFMSTKYISNADGKGWIIVKYSDGSTYPPLPQFVRVDFQQTQGDRDYFVIMEGRSATKNASVKLKSDGGSYLVDGDSTISQGLIHYIQSTGELFYFLGPGWVGPISIMTDPSNPVPVGSHDLEIPDEVHKLAESYESQSIYACSWFRIGHSGDRYLHTGQHSLGCATVTDVPKWTDIYNYLIMRRKNDGNSVGVLEVFATPSDRHV